MKQNFVLRRTQVKLPVRRNYYCCWRAIIKHAGGSILTRLLRYVQTRFFTALRSPATLADLGVPSSPGRARPRPGRAPSVQLASDPRALPRPCVCVCVCARSRAGGGVSLLPRECPTQLRHWQPSLYKRREGAGFDHLIASQGAGSSRRSWERSCLPRGRC